MAFGLIFAFLGDVAINPNFILGVILFALGHIFFVGSYMVYKKLDKLDIVNYDDGYIIEIDNENIYFLGETSMQLIDESINQLNQMSNFKVCFFVVSTDIIYFANFAFV